MELTQEYLKSILNYNPETGIFIWRVRPSTHVHIGSVAGVIHGGYRQIKISMVQFRAHRLAWLYMYGRWPIEYLDHINGIKDDNRIDNLREATASENSCNRKKRIGSSSIYLGVSMCKVSKKWKSTIKKEGNVTNLGIFLKEEEAARAYDEAAKLIHREFANLNFKEAI